MQELRYMLDEPVASKWPDPALYVWLNDGARQVNMLLKDIEQGWYVRVLNTASSALTIDNATYTPSTALLVANAGSLVTLPRDNIQILHLYPELTVDKTAGYRFYPSNLMKHRFEELSLTAPVSTDRTYYYEYQGRTQLKIAPAVNQEMKFELHYLFDPSEIVAVSDVDQVPNWAYYAVKLYAKHLAYRAIAHPDTDKIFAEWQAERELLQRYANPRSEPQFPTEVERKHETTAGPSPR